MINHWLTAEKHGLGVIWPPQLVFVAIHTSLPYVISEQLRNMSVYVHISVSLVHTCMWMFTCIMQSWDQLCVYTFTYIDMYMDVYSWSIYWRWGPPGVIHAYVCLYVYIYIIMCRHTPPFSGKSATPVAMWACIPFKLILGFFWQIFGTRGCENTFSEDFQKNNRWTNVRKFRFGRIGSFCVSSCTTDCLENFGRPCLV